MENSWPLGEDLSLLTTFHRLGVRMAGPVHSRTNQLADSATGEARWNGLSPLGRQWVAEMNRLGMLIDGSHSSDATFDQMLATEPDADRPVAFRAEGDLQPSRATSTTSACAGWPRPAASCSSTASSWSSRTHRRSANAINDRHENWANLDAGRAARSCCATAPRSTRSGPTRPPISTCSCAACFTPSQVMGVDHVGLGADWDGGGGVIGMEDITALPRITARLRREGLSDADIAKIMGGNLMRVLRQAQAAAQP